MTIRDCKTSEEARANGFSTLQWLRAFTFAEHRHGRIDASACSESGRTPFFQRGRNES